jgi:hypothetical protein
VSYRKLIKGMNVQGLEVDPPVLEGLQADDAMDFLHKRERYSRAVTEKNTGVPANKRII